MNRPWSRKELDTTEQPSLRFKYKQELFNSNAVFLEVHNSCLLARTPSLRPPEQQGQRTEFTQLS